MQEIMPKSLEEWKKRFKERDRTLYHIDKAFWPSFEDLHGHPEPPPFDSKKFEKRAEEALKTSQALLEQARADQSKDLVAFRKKHERLIFDAETGTLVKSGRLLEASRLYEAKRLALATTESEKRNIMRTSFQHVRLKDVAKRELGWVRKNLSIEIHRDAALFSLVELSLLDGAPEVRDAAVTLLAAVSEQDWAPKSLKTAKLILGVAE